jgi:S1-C subfamily serine protease
MPPGQNGDGTRRVTKLTGLVRVCGLIVAMLLSPLPLQRASANEAPLLTLLDLHPIDPLPAVTVNTGMPGVIRPGASQMSDSRQVALPVVVTPTLPQILDPALGSGKAGTGFFVGENGTLLTAAHVVSGCGRMQVISKYVRRSWVSLVATDEKNDIALLRAEDVHPPAVLAVANGAPMSGKLYVLGYPASAGLTIPAETWASLENQKFPPGVGALANPRELLWMSAPDVTHGYSGGPVFDPRQGAVVGIIKGKVDGGYLRLIRDMPTTGITIGPGIGRIRMLLHQEASYTPASLTSSTDEEWENTLRRATVHVLCWH